MRLPLLLLLVPATLAACDSLVRAMLWLASRRAATSNQQPAGNAFRVLVVVPARAESARLDATLDSTKDADVLLLLDGEDPAAEARARARGVSVVVKTPAGPSKGAALAWLVREHRPRIEAVDVVLLVDAGSRLGPGFFEHFTWPAGATALQTFISGTSQGLGAAATESERFAQTSEDRGREALGWNVRLRGTGTAILAATFLEWIPRLGTRVEDLELSLLLTAVDATIRMAPNDVFVLDDKPPDMTGAASQRARWLLGRYELLVRRTGAFARTLVRRPFEGSAFLVEIFGRPLSLTVPLRLIIAALVTRMSLIAAMTLAATALADVVLHATAHVKSPGAVLRLAGSWALALLLLPRALFRWMRVDR